MSADTSTVTKAVLARHSTRVFTDEPVSLPLVEEALAIAQHAPSSTNIQPWRLTFISGEPLQRLGAALTDAFSRGEASALPSIPAPYVKYRSELGRIVYGPEGYSIPREDKARHREAMMRNYSFYGAPLVAIVAIDKDLNDVDVLSVGLYLQSLLLLLTERGLHTQTSASPTSYPHIIKKELGIADNMKLLCTLAIGHEDPTQQINKLKMPREDWRENNIRFVTE